ncbi:hypothetical protein [Phyllobacterium lublinensis]|uniref:hypothetical protein n=1 Tax=Phyllobacterium lublinensis TaxID=2875708 RepID=UPI001CCBECA8|nr:hypothetical protein [Phyllobacterium sp. 2063]MBZ9654314.1 hypothetical protein [Phyllobacterium sp. 2063]
MSKAKPTRSAHVEPLKRGGGDGTFNDMEAQVAKLSSDMENIKTAVTDIKTDIWELRRDAKVDFRLLFGALIFVALGLAGLMAKGFHWL